jgi:hypothetical protein
MAAVMNGYAGVVSNLFSDAGFEELVGNEPNAATSPWFTNGENADGSFISATNEAHSGTNSAKYHFYFDDGAIVQNLNAQWDTNTFYEVAIWMLTAELSPNGTHSNTPTINIGLFASTNSGASYDFIATLYGGAINSDTNLWEKFTAVIDGSDYSDIHGADIQIRFNKPNKDTTHKIHIDDASFGEYTPDTPPDNVLIGYYGSAGTNIDYTAAGISGNLYNGKIHQLNANAGSTDGTYGSTNGASALLTAYEVRLGQTNDPNNVLGFRIVNNTGAPLQLDSISFDYAPWWVNSPKDVILTYAWGDLVNDDQTFINSATGLTHLASNKGDYYDFDWSLTGLDDYVLADKQGATFNLIATNAGLIWASGGFDNIAIMGSALTGTGYELWAAGHDLVKSKTGDDDYDGLINLYEYGLGGNPTNGFVDGHIPTFVQTAGGMEYVHAQRTDDPALIYYLQTDTDLILPPGWTNGGYTVTGTNETTGLFDFVTNIVPTAENTMFLRLIIEN